VDSGEKAVELLAHEKVDLLILDMIMAPGIDGLETYHRVKKSHPHQKAIITSGYAETHRVKTAQRLGAGGYLRKPYTVQNLAMAIKAELSRS
jgi:YesN/AraC family two-component response regulator